MSGANRKISRAKKKRAEKELKEKIFMFDKLGEECLVCGKPFDKTDKELVQSWTVVVRQTQNKVNLYCPECWTEANNIISEFRGGINNDD